LGAESGLQFPRKGLWWSFKSDCGSQPPQKEEWFKDRVEGDGRNKTLHDWQQGVGEAEQIIEHFTFEGDLVVDPFLGSGTNGVASKRLQRRFVGCDIDDKAVGTALNRIGKVG
jgi:DNA modification methylase